jgi:uncharacterized protein YndB with AHSA1/START domain
MTAAQWIATYQAPLGRPFKGTWPRIRGTVVSDDLKLERLFDASPEVVFGGFTGLQAQKEHYVDAAGWIVESQCGLRVGARGRLWSGLREPRRLGRPTCSRWVGWPRRLVCRPAMTTPDGSSVETGMEVTFREHDGRTRMMIVHGGIPAAGVWDEFVGGWASILDGPGRAAARVTDRSCT